MAEVNNNKKAAALVATRRLDGAGSSVVLVFVGGAGTLFVFEALGLALAVV